MVSNVDKCVNDGSELIFVDESIFKPRDFRKRAYMSKYENVNFNVPRSQESALAVVAAISKFRGLIHYQIRERSHNGESFREFMRALRKRCVEKRVVVLLDNCSIHKTNKVKEFCESESVDLVFNVSYSPWYNAIELFWARAKDHFRSIITDTLLGNKHLTLREAVIESLRMVAKFQIMKYCDLTTDKILDKKGC